MSRNGGILSLGLCAGILEQSMGGWGARNREGLGLSHRLVGLHRLAESNPGPLKSFKIYVIFRKKDEAENDDICTAIRITMVHCDKELLIVALTSPSWHNNCRCTDFSCAINHL
jgi:hypothetical protein